MRHLPLDVPVMTVRALAVAACADPRTVQKILRGEPVRGVVRERVIAEARARGIAVPPPVRAA